MNNPARNRQFDQRPVFVFSSPTTPNGDLHLGHLGGPYLGADAYVRFQKMNGARAFHIAGSDDFQSYVAGAARRDGRTPAETAAHYSAEILATHQLMDIEIDEYTVSNADESYPGRVREFFSRIAASDQVSLAEGAALFDAGSGQYLYEVDVSGGCPTCGHPTGGNMCEECGEPNFCADLTDPRAGTSEAPPRAGTITRYSLALHELAEDIHAHHRLGRVPARVKELTHRLFRRRPFDLAITHPGEWGVAPVEDGVPGQVIWVWIDMAYRFLHGIEDTGRKLGEDWQADSPRADWKIVHFLGYDNTFYHSIFVPALYRLAYPGWTPDIDYNLNEFSLLDGSKFSTSRRHAVWGKDILGPHSVDAVRCYLSWMRPEGRRTNFVMADYEAFVADTLVGNWQRWLNDLGSRVDKHYDGQAPQAGSWTPEQSALLARLSDRLSAVTNSLAQDGFSLNRAARELNGIVEDVLSFATAEALVGELEAWQDQARSAVALELAAAKLLATVSAPVMPRFAGRLAAALGGDAPSSWPGAVELVEPGTRIDLARQVFFGAPAEESALLPWLSAVVAEALRVPAEDALPDKSLALLGMTSMQSIALQYQIMDRTGVDLSIEELLGERSIAELAGHLQSSMSAELLAEFAEVPRT
ncbi:MAG: class I tRNA ligase family protein [Actinomycetota bacterium]|nr:class I tRNA ligase family protein [Actinomycetota bacterium]